MEKTARDLAPAAVAGGGGLVAMLASFIVGDISGSGTWCGILGGATAMGAAWWFRRRVVEPDLQVVRDKEEIEKARAALEEEKLVLTAYRDDLEEEAMLLEKRRHKLSQQLAQTVGFWDLDGGVEDSDKVSELTASEMQEKDRQVTALCRAEAERVFNKVIQNEYLSDGRFIAQEAFRDVLQLFEGVARVYRPHSDQPLLETSLEQLLRFVHSSSLQLLVQLEQLPLDIKRYNLREAYRFVKKAMDYYGMYKKAAPYWNYAKPAFFLGRFAMGANPIALGISWTVTELAQRGGKKISANFTRKYGLRLFHDTIRTLGSEAAGVYGAQFHQRDPDWIYALELTELAHQFPPTLKSLGQVLREVGALPLRSEYDRIFLYRCLANHASAQPQWFRGRELMRTEDKVRVAHRLERMVSHYFDLSDMGKVDTWKRGVEGRLGIRVRLAGEAPALTEEQQQRGALYSLCSYLIGIKEMEPEEAEQLLPPTQVASAMSTDTLGAALAEIRSAPPMMFDYPDLENGGSVLRAYLHDLLRLQIQVYPHTPNREFMRETAFYFRQSGDKVDKLFEEACQDVVTRRLPEDLPRPRPPLSMCVATLLELGAGEQPCAIYESPSIEGKFESPLDLEHLWLIMTNQRPGVLFALPKGAEETQRPFVLWTARGSIIAEQVRSLFSTDCRVRGGEWNQAWVRPLEGPLSIRVKSRRGVSYERQFAPLHDLASGRGLALPEGERA